MVKIAINGFGRIGRASFKAAFKRKDLEIVAVNDLANIEILAYLLAHDSVFGNYDKEVKVKGTSLFIDGKEVPIFSQPDPSQLPWGKLKVDVVLECTGVFQDSNKSKAHLEAGAKRVIISAPPKDKTKILCLGCNEEEYKPKKDFIVSNGSCTTNCLAPLAKILNDEIGIEKGLMTTIHSYTSTQNLVDGPNKDFRRSRSGSLNIVPTTTGAAIAVTRVIPALEGKFNGMAVRVPSPCVSLVDLVAKLKQNVTLEKVNSLFIGASQGSLKGILAVEKEPLVSSDFRGNQYSSIVDLSQTMVVGDLVKVIAWYDNEWGYSERLIDLAIYMTQEEEKK
jgi:glyceraldehyde 3-phosphate dehydrogenase